ncbi:MULTISPECIES: hypothetical protein [unclassified Lysinibacillus]|uniref:hypothetical protein n=1 Tax=unclassified Lysinibacillus TaxID=2636778 RepID=UPI0037F92E05
MQTLIRSMFKWLLQFFAPTITFYLGMKTKGKEKLTPAQQLGLTNDFRLMIFYISNKNHPQKKGDF